MAKFHSDIVGCYLYPITKYGYPPPAKNTILYIEELAYLGFSSIELEGIGPEHIREVFDMRKEIAEKIAELGIDIPVLCIVLPQLGSGNSGDLKSQLKFFKMGCEIAKTIGSKIILDNGPVPPFINIKQSPIARHYDLDIISKASLSSDFDWRSYWNKLIKTYVEVCQIATWYNLEYHIHPAIGTIGATPEAFIHLHESIGANNLKFNFDTANLLYLKVSLVLALNQLAPYISYIHISDSRGFINEHLPPGKGMIEWSSFFQNLRNIGFSGKFGIDIGGSESKVQSLDKAYKNTAAWLQKNWFRDPGEDENRL